MFKKTKCLGNVLKHSNRAPTDKFNQKHKVYKVPCLCSKAYFGESKQKNGNNIFQGERTTISEIDHDINWRKLLEAIHIYKNNNIAVNVYSVKSDIPKGLFPILCKLELSSQIKLLEVI